MRVQIRINNRKILAGIAEVAGVTDRFAEMTVSIDKLDKIGWDGVHKELERRGITSSEGAQIEKLFSAPTIISLENALQSSEIGLRGIQEIKQVQHYLNNQELHNQLIFDTTLARGLSYYTGCIFEVNALDFEIGSISGGGRYDDLTGVFGMKGVSGVGISFGAERIYDVMDALNLFPDNLTAGPTVICLAMDEKSHHYGFECVSTLRKAGIRADLYPDTVKLKKQMKFANHVGARYAVIIGDNETSTGLLTFKEMTTGEQQTMDLPTFISQLVES
jgi:histidyl-tRNA synthetase